MIPDNHQVSLTLPSAFPPGPAEVIVLAGDTHAAIVKLGGALSSEVSPEGDPVEETLRELRQERAERSAGDPILASAELEVGLF